MGKSKNQKILKNKKVLKSKRIKNKYLKGGAEKHRFWHGINQLKLREREGNHTAEELAKVQYYIDIVENSLLGGKTFYVQK